MNNAHKQAATIVDGYKITTPAAPAGAKGFGLSDINNQGTAVGTYDDATGQPHGAILQNGSLVAFNVPGEAWTGLAGINDKGSIIGQDASGGFIDQGGKITRIVATEPLGTNTVSYQTMPSGVNDHDEVVGAYWREGNSELSFIYRNGVVTDEIRDPNSEIATVATSVNNNGVIAGYYENATGLHGFIRATDGTFTTLDVSKTPDVNGEFSTMISGIDARGDLVGTYLDSNDKLHGFIDQGGTISTFDVPGAANTTLSGISENGSKLSGSYQDASGNSHGFTATLVGHNIC